MKKFVALFLALVMTISVFAGCSAKNTEADASTDGSAVQDGETSNSQTTSKDNKTSKDNEEEPIELLWYVRFDDQADTAKVNEALNELTMEKIGCTVKIANIPAASYNDKMQVILSGREECDLVFAGSSFADFWGNAARGAFMPLNDLLAEYAPETYAAIPEAFWDGVRMNGEIYGVINYQIEAKEAGIYARNDLLEKYDFDLSSVKEVRDIEPFLQAIVDNEPGVTPIWVNEVDLLPMMGYDEIGTYGSPGAVMIGDDTMTVVNQYETDEWRAFVDLMRDWYLKGYILSDVATVSSPMDLQKAGKFACSLNNQKPGGLADAEVQWGNQKMSEVKLMDGRVLSSAVSATMTCISSTSKHPEKAMEFINLLNTDKEVYNLVCFGIEGVHYNKIDDNRIELIDGSGYQPNKAWAMGNQFNAYVRGNQSDTVWEETIALNESASVSSLLGFVFDPTPVKNEVAQCQSVWDQYFLSIVRGTVDPDEYIPEFLEKLEAAGSEAIIAEKQAQLDAWLASK